MSTSGRTRMLGRAPVALGLLFSLWLLALPASAGSKAGTAAGQFLRLPVDARAVAMGQAFGALAEDATAAYWNPAGLGALRDYHVTLSHNVYLEGTFYDYVAYAQPVELFFWFQRKSAIPTGRYGSAAVSFFYLNAGDIDE